MKLKYSHLSNKRGVTLIDFEKKIHPPRTFPPSTFIDFLDFFHPPLHVYCIYVLVFSKKSHPPRLFQPPRLLILQLLHSLHVYSNLHGYQRDESKQQFSVLISASVTVFWKGHKNIILSKNLMYKMSGIIFKDVSLTKRAPAWKFFHSNEENKLAKCQQTQ